MARQQSIAPGVTVTWDRPAPAPRRRTTRRAGPVIIRTEPVRSPLPTAEQMALVRRGATREHLAALLTGTVVHGASPEAVDLRALARSLHQRGVERDTLLLALVEVGHPDAAAVSAVWWGSLDDKRAMVRTLLRHAKWSGDRVHEALRANGLPVWERSAVVDPLR